MHGLVVVGLLGVVLLAGCVSTTHGQVAAQPRAVPDWVLGADDLSFNSTKQCRGACLVRFEYAPGTAAGGERLEVLARWDGRATGGFPFAVTTPDEMKIEAKTGYWVARARIPDAAAGLYQASFVGNGSFDLSVRVVPGTPADSNDLLPNLVTLVPEDVGVDACSQYEQSEQGAQRCLRLTNAVGNIGQGPLEVRLDLPQAGLTPVGLGHFVQRVYQKGGGLREVAAAGSQIHLTHAHFHYAGLAGFQLFRFDAETGRQGESVSAMKKSGFCFIDIGAMDDPDVKPAPYRYDGLGCFVPDPVSWVMGVSVGWFDEYGAGLDEQYVEISGVPDGVYELVSTADSEGTLLEMDDTDNAASVVLRLTGDDVDILKRRGFWRIPNGP